MNIAKDKLFEWLIKLEKGKTSYWIGIIDNKYIHNIKLSIHAITKNQCNKNVLRCLTSLWCAVYIYPAECMYIHVYLTFHKVWSNYTISLRNNLLPFPETHNLLSSPENFFILFPPLNWEQCVYHRIQRYLMWCARCLLMT